MFAQLRSGHNKLPWLCNRPIALKQYKTMSFHIIFFLCTSGWRISDGSIRSGLENTCLLGRSQFLTSKEAETLGLSKSMIMLDGGYFLSTLFIYAIYFLMEVSPFFFFWIVVYSCISCIAYDVLICLSAHTKDSARAVVHTIQMTFPGAHLALVVAMASDKDHVGFAREFLSGICLSCLAVLYIVSPFDNEWRTGPHSSYYMDNLINFKSFLSHLRSRISYL